MKIIAKILMTALAVMLAASIVPGISIAGFWTAVLVAIVFGVLNVLIGLPLKVLTFPLTLISFGLFLLVINAFVFWMASFVKGFEVHGFWAAFWGGLIITLVSLIGKALFRSK